MPRNDGLETEAQAQPRDDGVERDAAAELSGLPYVRLTQRVAAPRERRSLWVLLAIVLLAHVVLVWLAWLVLGPSPYRHEERGVIAVSLIEPGSNQPPPPPLVEPPPLPGQPPPRRVPYEPPAKGAISATLEGTKEPPLELYRSNGQVRLPSGSGPATPTPAYSAPAIPYSHISSGKSPIPYKPTRFNKYWAPDKQSLGAKTIGRAFDKAVDKTSVKKTIHLPGGIKIHCAIMPLLLAAGCGGDAPQPPASNEDDIRLSLPPPETLTGKKVVVPKSASSTQPAPSSSR
jgi:hypothetical protein